MWHAHRLGKGEETEECRSQNPYACSLGLGLDDDHFQVWFPGCGLPFFSTGGCLPYGIGSSAGIGFLGAGVIFVKRDNIIGVTTAAGLWATVGIGLAIGCGFYAIGISCTVLILVIQYLMHKQEHNTFSTNTGSITINLTKHDLTLTDVKKKLDSIHITIRNITMTHTHDGDVLLKASIICSRAASVPGIMEEMSRSGFIDDIEIYTID